MRYPRSLKRQIRWAVWAVSLGAALVLSAFQGGRSFVGPSDHGVVVKVIDGDTVEVKGVGRVRYIGIDTPETHRRTSAGWSNVSEPFGDEAARLNSRLVLNKPVRLESDVTKKDKFGRTLAYVFVDQGGREVMAQDELLRQGFAYLYTFPPNVKYVDRFVKVQREARAAKRGVWGDLLTVDAADAKEFIGQRRCVAGTVVKTRRTPKTLQLLMTDLKLVIFADGLEAFRKEGIDPATAYTGRPVRVVGKIKEYQGAAEIIVDGPWQILDADPSR